MASIPNKLSLEFGSQAVRKQLVALYADGETMFTGANEHGETVYLSIAASGMVLKAEQTNGWVRVNYYDADGIATGESFDGEWRDTHGQVESVHSPASSGRVGFLTCYKQI